MYSHTVVYSYELALDVISVNLNINQYLNEH